MSSETSRKDLTEALLKREKWAIEALYVSAYESCSSFVLKNSGTKDDAFDCFQEAMVVFIRYLGRADFSLNAKPETLLYSIMRNRWLKQLRKTKGKVMVPIESTSSIEFVEDQEMIEKEHRLRTIDLALKQLQDDCRKLIRGFYFEKVDLKVLAEKLGYSYKFIRVKKVRCMTKLKELVSMSKEWNEI